MMSRGRSYQNKRRLNENVAQVVTLSKFAALITFAQSKMIQAVAPSTRYLIRHTSFVLLYKKMARNYS